MANFTVNVTSSVNVFGSEPSDLWGAIVWGSGKWGYGTNAELASAETVFSESEALSDAETVDVGANTSDSIASSYDNAEEYLMDGSGYFYVFKDPVTNAEDRNEPTYTSGIVAEGTTYTSQAAGSTVWS